MCCSSRYYVAFWAMTFLATAVIAYGCGRAPAPPPTIVNSAESISAAPLPEPLAPEASAAPDEASQPPRLASAADAETAPFYTVGHYDPVRDPGEDLALTVERAKAEKKRILIQVGGQWCGWCHRLDKYVRETESVSMAISESFLVMKVNYGQDNPNEEFLAGYPKIPGYPHLFVLDGDGTFLHSQGTAELEEGDGYSKQAVLAFLELWKPAS